MQRFLGSRFSAPTLLVALAFLGPGASGLQDGSTPRLVFESRSGELREVDPIGLSLTDPRDKDAWFIRPAGFKPSAADPTGDASAAKPLATVVFANGDELRARLAGGDGETLGLELAGGVELPVHIERIAKVLLPGRESVAVLSALEAPEEGDRLYRRTGSELDRIDGTLESFSASGVRFESVIGSKDFGWGEIAALTIEVFGGDQDAAAVDGTPVVCDLVGGGGRIRGMFVGLDGRGCRLRVGGAPLALDWGAIGELSVDDGSLVFLTDRAPLGEEGQGAPFGDDLGMLWPHRIDRNVQGEELVVNGRTFRRGLGTHAPTRVRWDLERAFQGLRGLVGIDDSSLLHDEEARGAVIFRVLVDGDTRWESGLIRGGDGLTSLPLIDLAGAEELVLEADPAGDFRGDRANWLRMVLVR